MEKEIISNKGVLAGISNVPQEAQVCKTRLSADRLREVIGSPGSIKWTNPLMTSLAEWA